MSYENEDNTPDNRIDWANTPLPDAWPDTLRLTNPVDLWRFVYSVLRRKRATVVLPAKMPGIALIPSYVLQEFHNLPNGNYSSKLVRGYATGFDVSMLGILQRLRLRLADLLQPACRTLDIGCGSGRMAPALQSAGTEQSWGIDPSPYLLQCAAQHNPGLLLLQGVGEKLEFADASFDAVSVCFVFHEIPPRYAEQMLKEIHRVLKPGGKLGVVEPSFLQRKLSSVQLLRRFGWRGIYFRLLAHFVHEPFVEAWHRCDLPTWFAEAGFTVLQDDDRVPCRLLLLERCEQDGVHKP